MKKSEKQKIVDKIYKKSSSRLNLSDSERIKKSKEIEKQKSKIYKPKYDGKFEIFCFG